MNIRKLIFFAAFIASIACVSGCGDQTSASADQHSDPPAVADIPVRDHFYTMSDGLKYGYESSLSADQKQRGVADPGLVMAVFYGKKGATYEAAIIGESTPEILSCTDDCQYIKSVTMFDGEPIRETYMHNDGQSIASGIMRDAIAGKLKQYEGTHSYSEASGKYKNHHEITYEVTEHYRFWMADGHITRTLVATERKPTDNQQD